MNQTDTPACHRCGSPPMMQWARRATDAETQRQIADIARLQGRMLSEAEIVERYGPLQVAVAGCSRHHLGDGDHQDSGLERRALLHDADCVGHGACICGTDGRNAA